MDDIEDRIFKLECAVAQLKADITTNRKYDKWLMNLPTIEQQAERNLKNRAVQAIENLFKE